MRKIITGIGIIAVIVGIVYAGKAWTTLRVNARTTKFNEDVENLSPGFKSIKNAWAAIQWAVMQK